MNGFFNSIAAPVTAIAMGIAGGFLGISALARGIDAFEANRCPGVTRVRVNSIPMLKDWGAYGICPRSGLTAPLKP